MSNQEILDFILSVIETLRLETIKYPCIMSVGVFGHSFCALYECTQSGWR